MTMQEKRLSLLQKLNIACALCASLFLIYISIFPLIRVFTYEFSKLELIKNSIILFIGIGAGLGAFSLVKQALLFESMIDTAFEEGVYRRLKPLLKEIASVQARLEEATKKMNTIDVSIDDLKERVGAFGGRGAVSKGTSSRLGGGTYPSDPILFLIKIVVLINITFAAFLFMVQYPRGFVPYVVTAMFFIWWIGITTEYNLWHNVGVWVWGSVPILIIPTVTILMDILLPSEIMFSSLYIVLGIYAYIYYAWSIYMLKGKLPPTLHNLLREVSTFRKTERL
ncbi:MAG: hypothetical protein QMC78_03260 [Methanocellales archaeon]|nr:hypothetical protein [Methanocellales archaeon]